MLQTPGPTVCSWCHAEQVPGASPRTAASMRKPRPAPRVSRRGPGNWRATPHVHGYSSTTSRSLHLGPWVWASCGYLSLCEVEGPASPPAQSSGGQVNLNQIFKRLKKNSFFNFPKLKITHTFFQAATGPVKPCLGRFGGGSLRRVSSAAAAPARLWAQAPAGLVRQGWGGWLREWEQLVSSDQSPHVL